MGGIVVKDDGIPNDIKFWLGALENKNITRENKRLLNQCLSNALVVQLNPLLIKGLEIDVKEMGVL